MRDKLNFLSKLYIHGRVLGLRLAWILVMLCSSAAWCADSYNAQTGVLSIPSVMVNGTQYNNVQVTIAKVVSLGTGVGSTPNGTVDI